MSLGWHKMVGDICQSTSVEQQPNCRGWEKVLNLGGWGEGLSGLSLISRCEITWVFDEPQT